MFGLYCLPGKAIAHLRWLFPSGWFNLYESDRQRDSVFIHFLFSTGVYAAVAFFLLHADIKRYLDLHSTPSAQAQQFVKNGGDLASEPMDDDGDEDASYSDNASEDFQARENFATVTVENAPAVEVESLAQSVVPTPSTSPALAKSIEDAVASGATVRWTDDDDGGYVVVSEPQSGGKCRNMYYTADSQGKDWKSNVTTICS